MKEFFAASLIDTYTKNIRFSVQICISELEAKKLILTDILVRAVLMKAFSVFQKFLFGYAFHDNFVCKHKRMNHVRQIAR